MPKWLSCFAAAFNYFQALLTTYYCTVIAPYLEVGAGTVGVTDPPAESPLNELTVGGLVSTAMWIKLTCVPQQSLVNYSSFCVIQYYFSIWSRALPV